MPTFPISRRRFILSSLSLVTLVCATLEVRAAGASYQAGRNRIWPKNVVKAVQNKLSEMGYEPGEADGLYGSKTAEAISAFQRDKQLQVNGKISKELVATLLQADQID